METAFRPNDVCSDEVDDADTMLSTTMTTTLSRIHYGGAVEVSKKSSSSSPQQQQPTSKQQWRSRPVILALIVSATSIIIATQNYKESLRAMLDKHVATFKSNLLEKLKNINEHQGNTGLVIYIIAFALWEGLGLTTAPIESMAGMVFGFRRAIVPNFVGKFSGALLAFGIGRVFLYDRVKAKLRDNEVMGLVEQSIQEKPVRMTLLMRFFPFPELVKNLALAVMPLSVLAFASATFLNQFAFSILWTLVGADAASALDPNAPPSNPVLRIIVLGVAIFGIVGSPAFLALYLNALRKGASS